MNILLYRIATLGLTKGPHITRYSMYQCLSKYSETRPEDHRVLSISHSEQLARLLGYSSDQIINVEYPQVSILSLPFENDTFDAVVSDQVLEHIKGDPFAAVKETFRVVKPGGIVLHTTCLINPLHGEPMDHWRFTPYGLRLLIQGQGKVIDAEGWGNPYVWPFCFLGLRFLRIPHATWHPAHWLATKNNKKWLISTWVLARKSAYERLSSESGKAEVLAQRDYPKL